MAEMETYSSVIFGSSYRHNSIFCFTALQDYFHHFHSTQLYVVRKREIPWFTWLTSRTCLATHTVASFLFYCPARLFPSNPIKCGVKTGDPLIHLTTRKQNLLCLVIKLGLVSGVGCGIWYYLFLIIASSSFLLQPNKTIWVMSR